MSTSHISVWIQAARPKTLPAAIAPVLIGTAMAFADNAGHWLSAIAAMLGAIFIQIGTNLANDYFDYKKGTDTHERLGPTRVTQAGLVSPKATRNATIVAFGLAFIIGVYLVYRGGPPIVAIGLLSILFGVAYTGGPFPLAYIGVADLFVLIFFGPVAVGGTYYVQTLRITSDVVIAGLAPGFLSIAILSVNNLRDIESDRKGNKRTLAVRFGQTFTRYEYIATIALAAAVPVYLVTAGGNHTASLAALLAIPISAGTIRTVLTREGRILNESLAGTGRMLFFFSVLFSAGWLI